MCHVATERQIGREKRRERMSEMRYNLSRPDVNRIHVSIPLARGYAWPRGPTSHARSFDCFVSGFFSHMSLMHSPSRQNISLWSTSSNKTTPASVSAFWVGLTQFFLESGLTLGASSHHSRPITSSCFEGSAGGVSLSDRRGVTRAVSSLRLPIIETYSNKEGAALAAVGSMLPLLAPPAV